MAKEQGAGAPPELSVIVPVCNVERYVGACLESLAAQTLGSMEILLVDDGSTDDCPRLLAEAAARDGRMRVISKPNGGYGSAVNAGLEQARGRYVGIVEPDDFVEPCMYADLLDAARLPGGAWADVVKSSYWLYYDLPGEQPSIEAPNLMNCMPPRRTVASPREEFEVLFHHPSVWSAIYRRDYLAEHGIRMVEAPGGGWVDNPFFYETLLQTDSFVWVPGAYYYYRQTNPGSSSNLKDYRLPFDRLRDLRALYARLEIDDPQLIACLYSRHFSYIGSVIGEWGFSEQDPELAALIREALSAMDPAVLYGGHRGLRKEHLAFYESIMGDPAAHIAARERPASVPLASVVVPACNDRDVLGDTLADLAAQSLEDIEVICVDCGSVDRTPQIAAAFAARDARFTCVRIDEQDVARGAEAGLARASAAAVAVVLPGAAVPKKHLARATDALAAGADLYVAVRAAKRAHSPFAQAEGAGVFAAAGNNAALLLCAAENLSGCAFGAGFLRAHDLHVRPGDAELHTFLLRCVNAAGSVALVQGKAPTVRKVRRTFAQASDKSDLDVFEDHRRALAAAYAAAQGLDADAVRAAQCLAVRVMLDDLRLFSGSAHAEQIFAALRRDFQERYGLAEAPIGTFVNQNAYQSLKRSLCTTYVRSLQREAARLHGANNSLNQRCASIKGSGSYRLGNALVRAGRRVLPTALRRHLRT